MDNTCYILHAQGWKKHRRPSHYMKVLDQRSSIKESVSVSIQLIVSSLKIFQFSGIMVLAYFSCGVCLATFVTLHSLHSYYIVTGSWRWRRQQSAGKRKVRLQQYTLALIAASTASAVEKLIIVGTRRLLYITHRTFQPYHWWSRKLWNKLDCSRLARNLNKTIYYNCEASRTLRRSLRRSLLTVFVGVNRIQQNWNKTRAWQDRAATGLPFRLYQGLIL